jgi:hypothetical protein
MRKILAAALVAVAFSGSAMADLYKVNFMAPSNSPGKMWNYGFTVDLQFAEGGAITGEVKDFFGANACRWPGIKITGGNLPDGTFRWLTDENPVKGCGKLVFVGKKEGDKLVGFLPRFQGVKVDLTLEPTK